MKVSLSHVADLASLVGAEVTGTFDDCEGNIDDIRVGFVRRTGYSSHTVLVDIVAKEDEVQVHVGWASKGDTTICEMQVALAGIARFIEMLRNWSDTPVVVVS